MKDYLSVLNPFPTEEKLVYGKVIGFKEIEDSGKFIVEITLTNDEMLKFDKDIYGSEGLLDSIVKYFIKPIDSYKDRIKNFINEYIPEEELAWLFNNTNPSDSIKKSKLIELLKMEFDRFTPYFYEFSAFIKNEETIKILSQYYENGSYYRFKLISSNDNSNMIEDEMNVITGETLFSASPIDIRKSQLVIVDKVIDPKYLVDDIVNYSDFETKDNVLDNMSPIAVKEFNNSLNQCLPRVVDTVKYTMYHVGQGLCSYISFNRNYGMFFDIGFSRDARKDTSIQLDASGFYNKYKNRTPKAIFLSHWDLDHILGVVYCSKEIYNRIWIAPNINEIKPKKRSNSALRLSKYISLRESMLNLSKMRSYATYEKTLFLISKNYNDNQVFKSNNGKLILHKGKGTGTKNHSNKENNIGLILEIRNSKKLLLTGDVDYIKMPKSIINRKFDFLQVPHHGANVGTPIYRPTKVIESIAIVPVSKVNRHNHPKDKEHLDILEGYGFRIHRTDNNGDFTADF